MEFSGCSLDEFYIKVDNSSRGMMGRERAEQDDSIYKSKNLHAERKRRQKLSDSLLALRSLVPTITNMTRACIIEDAITYIQELQDNVKILSDQLFEMEATSEEAAKTMTDEMDAAEEMKQSGIEEDVQVTSLDGNRMWIKIILEKKRGRFTRLLEAMSCLGLELIDTSVTTSRGAILVSSSVQGTYGDTLGVPETKELLLDIMRNI